MTNLPGGHIDMAVTALYNAAARLRIVGISAPRRYPGPFAAVPTWKEQGAQVLRSFWRGVTDPRGLSEARIRHWDGVLDRTAATARRKELVARNLWDDNYMGNRDFAASVQRDYVELTQLLGEPGPAK